MQFLCQNVESKTLKAYQYEHLDERKEILKHFENVYHTCKLQCKCKTTFFHIDFPCAHNEQKCEPFVFMVEAINPPLNISTE